MPGVKPAPLAAKSPTPFFPGQRSAPAAIKPPAVSPPNFPVPVARFPIQPLTYSRFQGFSSLYNWFYSAQETRINALEQQLIDDVQDTQDYFKKERSWMGEPDAFWELQRDLRVIRNKTYNQTEYNQVETDLQGLQNRLNQLTTGWSQVTWKQTPAPATTLAKGIVKSRGDIYWDSKMVNLKSQTELRGFVRKLFQRFIDFGFRYDANIPAVNEFLDTDEVARKTGLMTNPMTLERHGSCITLAFSFAKLLERFGLQASAEWVVHQNQSFICKVAHFIDPSVHGNLEVQGVLKPGYFVFTGHAATRIKGLEEFYDPMARKWYTKPEIECYLQDKNDGSQTFEIKGNCKTLNVTNQGYYIKADPKRRTGGLSYYKLKAKAG